MVEPSDLSETLLEIADDWTQPGTASVDMGRRSLERLRQRLDAAVAELWLVSDGTAQQLLHVGRSQKVPAIIRLAADAIPIQRLRRHGALRCSAGEVSGVEPLIPSGLQSYIVASATHQGTVGGILVIGWHVPAAPVSERLLPDLRIAASLLIRGIAHARLTGQEVDLPASVLDSFVDPIVVLDRTGTIIAVNTVWSDSTRHEVPFTDTSTGIGVNYLDVCRRSTAQGSVDASRALSGLLDVCGGVTQAFELAYECAPPGETRWWLLRAVRLRRAEGGAIIRHVEITGSTTVELTRIVGAEQFRHLADTLRVPILSIDAAGLLLFANLAWNDATGGDVRSGAPWTDACHPADRDAAQAAVRAAVTSRSAFDIEVRLLTGSATYRWWAVEGAPHFSVDGHLLGFVMDCQDAGPVRHAQQALHDAGARLIASQETVRSRIARELHDDLGQQVVMLATHMNVLLHRQKLPSKQLHAELERIHDGLQELARNIHNLSHELHPAKLRLLGLERTISSLSREAAASSGVHVEFRCEGINREIPDDRALCIFRIAQEALQNAVKHSGAKAVDVWLSGSAAEVTLRVTDDGIGFDSLALSTGLGLVTMRERVELIGGTLRIHTARATGTTIEATVPIAPSAA